MTGSRFPGAMQRVALREALLRRTGIAKNTVLFTAPALQRTAPQGLRAALRPGHGRLRRRRDHAVAAVVLGAVERGVGALQHVGDSFALALQRRESDRDRHVDALAALLNRERLAGDRTA